MPATRPLALLLAALAGPAAAQEPRLSSVDATGSAAEAWALDIAGLEAGGRLRRRATDEDTQVPGRRHVRYTQVAAGFPVYGAEIVRQVDGTGRTLSVFGRLAEEPVPASPVLDEAAALRAARAAAGGELVGAPELVWFPLEAPPRLAWSVLLRTAEGLPRVFIDAADGRVLGSWDELRTESAVGIGTWGDPKKLSVQRGGAGFVARDGLRPAEVATWDLRDDLGLAYWHRVLAEPGDVNLAADTDNDWRDGAVVDAHAYAGWTYDYLYTRHGRHGADGADGPIRSFVHYRQTAQERYSNAFHDPVTGGFYYGDGDGVEWNSFAAGLDVVAHEIGHAVTGSTWGGIYSGESGALNEAFSDILGAAVEFFHQPEGDGRLKADWWLGEDVAVTFAPPATAVRSLSDPRAICSPRTGCAPDHVSVRYTGREDAGGIHINSSIVNHAYYLFVQGGTNRTSGQRVAGLSLARRDRAERIFFRGFVYHLTPWATFADARRATLQAALDLYGEGEESRQLRDAWSAVGVD